MRTIGIREFKEQASSILREVREEGTSVDLTYRGRIIARVVPVHQPNSRPDDPSEFWVEWDHLASDISAHWPDNVSALDAVLEGRREL